MCNASHISDFCHAGQKSTGPTNYWHLSNESAATDFILVILEKLLSVWGRSALPSESNMFYLRLTVITETIKQELSVPSSKAAEETSGKAAEKEKWLEKDCLTVYGHMYV